MAVTVPPLMVTAPPMAAPPVPPLSSKIVWALRLPPFPPVAASVPPLTATVPLIATPPVFPVVSFPLEKL